MPYPLPLSKDHQIFQQEYCSGYTDSFGKWNTGFYCPAVESKTAVSCCGTATFKYCCITERSDSEISEFDDVAEHVNRAPMLVAIITGALLALIVITTASCFFCSCCFVYKKRRGAEGGNGGLYRMQSPSTASELVNMYSPCNTSNHTSLVTTPLDIEWNQVRDGSFGGSGGGGCNNMSSNVSVISGQQQATSYYVNLPPASALNAAAVARNNNNNGYPRVLNPNGLLRSNDYNQINGGVHRYQNVPFGVNHSNSFSRNPGGPPPAFYHPSSGHHPGSNNPSGGGGLMWTMARPSLDTRPPTGMGGGQQSNYLPATSTLPSILRDSQGGENRRCMRPPGQLVEQPPNPVWRTQLNCNSSTGAANNGAVNPERFTPPPYQQASTNYSLPTSNSFSVAPRPASDTFSHIYYNELRNGRIANAIMSNTLPRRLNNVNHVTSLPPSGYSSATLTRRNLPVEAAPNAAVVLPRDATTITDVTEELRENNNENGEASEPSNNSSENTDNCSNNLERFTNRLYSSDSQQESLCSSAL